MLAGSDVRDDFGQDRVGRWPVSQNPELRKKTTGISDATEP
jgi:hypothetical protein